MWVFFFNQSNINSVRDLYVLKTKDCVKCNSGIMIFLIWMRHLTICMLARFEDLRPISDDYF